MPPPDPHYTVVLINHETREQLKIELIDLPFPGGAQLPDPGSPREINMSKHYVYVLRSLSDQQFYVGLTENLPARLQEHNSGRVSSTRRRMPLELLYWEGCFNRSDAAQREKYLKTAWGKRYLKARLRRYLTG